MWFCDMKNFRLVLYDGEAISLSFPEMPRNRVILHVSARKVPFITAEEDGTATDFQTQRIQIYIRNQQGMQCRGLESHQLGKRI